LTGWPGLYPAGGVSGKGKGGQRPPYLSYPSFRLERLLAFLTPIIFQKMALLKPRKEVWW
jgi:hypothetical protein